MSNRAAFLSFSFGLSALALGAVSVIPMTLAVFSFTLFSFVGVAALAFNGNPGLSQYFPNRGWRTHSAPHTNPQPTLRKVVVNDYSHTNSNPHRSTVKKAFVPSSQMYQAPIPKPSKTVRFAQNKHQGVAQKVAVVPSASEPHLTKVVGSSAPSQPSLVSARVNDSAVSNVVKVVQQDSSPAVKKVVRGPETKTVISSGFQPSTFQPASIHVSGQPSRTQIINRTDQVVISADRGPSEGVKLIKKVI